MIIIEFFGPSGSGKSYFKKRLIKNFAFKIVNYKSLYNIIGARSLFSKIFYSFVKIPFFQRIKNTYFAKKIKKLFFGIIEIKKIEYKNTAQLEPELYKKTKFIKKLIQKINFKNKYKKYFENWANEEIYVNHYAKKEFNDQKILIDSEGLIQRLFIYCYKKKNKREIIKKYLNLVEIPHIIVFFKKRKVNKKNEFQFKNEENEEKKIFDLTLLELKKKNILIIDSTIGINKSYLKIKKKLRL